MTRPHQPHIDRRFNIDASTNDTPPSRHRSAQQSAHGFIWHSTTQELIPMLPKDHPQYRENTDRVLAAIRRWNGEAK
jgi:hypothetical protein